MLSTVTRFPFAQYWWLYAGFVLFVLAILALDLGVLHRRAHAVANREALGWSIFWVGLALAFNAGLYCFAGWAFQHDARLQELPGFDSQAAARLVALEFLSGYVVEKALAVDNLFVFIVLFSYFNVPAQFQHRILFFGILGALLFRSIFIAAGSALFAHQSIAIVFGVLLIVTGLKTLFAPRKPLEPDRNPVVRLLRKWLPVTSELDGQRFLVRRNGRWLVTPLLLTLILVEVSDVIFAADSVPAVFAITKEPLLVFTSNVFAILGLRALYFLLSGVIDKFRFLKHGLGVVLVFVGSKMVWLNEAFGGKLPIAWSLGVIGSVLAISIFSSLLIPQKRSGQLAHP